MGLRLSSFPNAGQLDGTELIGLVQDGKTVKARVDDIAIIAKGPPGSAGEAYPTRAALSDVIALARDDAFLAEPGREGKFIFYDTDFATQFGASLAVVDPAQGIYVAPASDPSGHSGAWVRLFNGFMKPEWFGAHGDGVTNDHAAFEALSAIGAYFGFLAVELAIGATYLCGAQVANALDSEGFGPFYRANVNPIEAINLKSVAIRGNGALIKTVGGLQFGAYNTGTGAPQNYTNAAPAAFADQAHLPYMVNIVECDDVCVEDLNTDGNSAAQTIAGTTDDSGIQCRHTGLRISGCKRVVVSGGVDQNFLLDGYTLWQTGLTESDDSRPHTIINRSVNNVGRNDCSMVGGNPVHFIGCVFMRPANAPKLGGGTLGSAPKSCVDLEAEASVIRNVRFTSCFFHGGPNASGTFTFGGDVKDVIFDGCLGNGRNWFNAKQVKAVNCRFYGAIINNWVGAREDETSIEACFITDEVLGDTAPPADVMLGSGGGGEMMLKRCIMKITRGKIPEFNVQPVNTIDCKIVVACGTEALIDGSAIANFDGGAHLGMEIVDAIPANFPATGYYAAVTTGVVRNSQSTPGGHVRWLSADPAVGTTGNFDNTKPVKGLANPGAASTTVYPRKDKSIQVLATPLTVNIDLTLNTLGAQDGDEFTVTRSAAATGGFSCAVLNGGDGSTLLTLDVVKKWGRFVYNGGAAGWQLIAEGTLP